MVKMWNRLQRLRILYSFKNDGDTGSERPVSSYFINKSGCKRGAGRASHETTEDSVKLTYDYPKRKMPAIRKALQMAGRYVS